MTVDLRTRYLGLELRSPIVASAAPQNGEPAMAARLEAAGVGAIVLPSLFEEEIVTEELELNRSLEQGTEHFAEALDYFPAVDAVHRRGRPLPRRRSNGSRPAAAVPIIASLNATTAGGWVRYARLIQEAGADALELNLYHVAADPRRSAADMEAADLELIAAVRAAVAIPLAVKLSPYYSAFAHFAAAATDAGADGLVLFNRFYQPDLDLETLEVVPRLELSQPWEMRLPVRWIAILRPQLGPGVSLAATSGVQAGTDVVKGLMVGADVVMMTSALLRHGPEHVADRGGRAADVDDRARVRIGRPAPGKRQPGHDRGPVSVRARQLHAHAPIVGRAARPDADGAVPASGLAPRDLTRRLVDARPARSVVRAEPGADLRPQVLAGCPADDDPDMTALDQDLRRVLAADALRDDGRGRPRRDLIAARGDVEDRAADVREANRPAVHVEHVPSQPVLLVELDDPLAECRAGERDAVVHPAIHRLPAREVEVGIVRASWTAGDRCRHSWPSG